MILVTLSPKLLEIKYAAYCTIVSPIPIRFKAHNLRTDSHRDTDLHAEPSREKAKRQPGSEFSDAECRRESRQALTSSTATKGLVR